jgi:hypothetical protein
MATGRFRNCLQEVTVILGANNCGDIELILIIVYRFSSQPTKNNLNENSTVFFWILLCIHSSH